MVSKSRKHYLLLLLSNKAMHLKIMQSNVINSIVTGAVIDPNTTTQLLGKIDKFFCTIKSIFASFFFSLLIFQFISSSIFRFYVSTYFTKPSIVCEWTSFYFQLTTQILITFFIMLVNFNWPLRITI